MRISDWSSDVCSSDLPVAAARRTIVAEGIRRGEFRTDIDAGLVGFAIDGACAHIFSSVESRRVILGDGALDRPLVERYVQTVSDLIPGGMTRRSVLDGRLRIETKRRRITNIATHRMATDEERSKERREGKQCGLK